MKRIAILALAGGLAAAGASCSDNKPADAVDVQPVKTAVEPDQALGQSSVKISVDPRTGEILPGGVASVEAQAPQQAPEYWVTDSPVSGQLLHSSTGFMTPLTAVIGCDGSVKIGHGVSSTGDADCGSGEGQ